MIMPDRKYSGPNYRFGFNGKEMDNEVKVPSAQYDYGFRIYDARMGRFLTVDPLSTSYPWFTPYQFAGNSPIAFIDLDGLEFALPRILPRINIPSPVISFPKVPTIPIPASPNYPMPPIIVNPEIEFIPSYPQVPTIPSIGKFESAINWNEPPAHPNELGDEWEETTHPENKSGSRDFQHKKTKEEIRWDPGKKDKSGWEASDHWHRYNPNRTGKGDYYLDRFGKPVPKGSGPSHIGAGQSLLDAIPTIIEDMNLILDVLQKQRDKYNILNPYDWKDIRRIRDKMKPIEEFIDKLKDYKEAWDEYKKENAKCDHCA